VEAVIERLTSSDEEHNHQIHEKAEEDRRKSWAQVSENRRQEMAEARKEELHKLEHLHKRGYKGLDLEAFGES